jgi:hypothetical protein
MRARAGRYVRRTAALSAGLLPTARQMRTGFPLFINSSEWLGFWKRVTNDPLMVESARLWAMPLLGGSSAENPWAAVFARGRQSNVFHIVERRRFDAQAGAFLDIDTISVRCLGVVDRTHLAELTQVTPSWGHCERPEYW